MWIWLKESFSASLYLSKEKCTKWGVLDLNWFSWGETIQGKLDLDLYSFYVYLNHQNYSKIMTVICFAWFHQYSCISYPQDLRVMEIDCNKEEIQLPVQTWDKTTCEDKQTLLIYRATQDFICDLPVMQGYFETTSWDKIIHEKTTKGNFSDSLYLLTKLVVLDQNEFSQGEMIQVNWIYTCIPSSYLHHQNYLEIFIAV